MVPHLGHTELTVVLVVAGVYMWAGQRQKRDMLQQTLLTLGNNYLHALSLELTFAGLHSFKPPVINISIASTSTVLKPSTVRSATTDSAGFLERATFWTHHRINDR